MTISPQMKAFLAKLNAKPVVEPIDEASSRVLRMSGDAEKSACRFMDTSYDAGHLDHVVSVAGKPWAWRPSDLWVFAWCMLGTSHRLMLSALRPSHGIHRLEPPCTMGEIIEAAAVPALAKDEADYRADRFCGLALDRARQLYRDGFYADPFTYQPRPRATPSPLLGGAL